MNDGNRQFDEVYGLLVHVCEQQTALAGEARLAVMDAFNGLAELQVPTQIPTLPDDQPVDRIDRAIQLLDGLVAGSKHLERTLVLLDTRRQLRTAMEALR